RHHCAGRLHAQLRNHGADHRRAFLGDAQLVKKDFFDKLVDGGVNYPQFAMVTLLRLAACSVPASQFSMVAPRLRTALAFGGAVFRVFAPLSPVSPAHSPLAARGYGPAYFRASPSKLPGPSRPLASLTAARCSGAADALWA